MPIRTVTGNIATLTDDITGHRFGMLTVSGIDHLGVNGCQFWLCHCDCGNTTILAHASLTNKGPRSCGCIRHKHGLSRTRTYEVWRGMVDRCCNSKSKHFPNYGGRGITICDRWKRFLPFFEDMGIAPDDLEIERVDNDGNYCKENCRWATRQEQMQNTRQSRLITFQGKTQCLRSWSRETGISFRALHGRLSRGWSVADTLTIPATRFKPLMKVVL